MTEYNPAMLILITFFRCLAASDHTFHQTFANVLAYSKSNAT